MDTSSSIPKDSAAGILAKNTTIPEIIATCFRVRFLFTVREEIIISSKLKEDVNVANKNNSKNKAKNNEPKAI